MAVNAKRVEVLESKYTYSSNRLDGVLIELDKRVNGADLWLSFTRTSGLISKIEYFIDELRTKKVCEQNITRVTGIGSVQLVGTIQTIFFNSNGTEDSQVNATLNRPGLGVDDVIQTCDSPFSTTEPMPC